MITVLAENNKVVGFIVGNGRGDDKEFNKFLTYLYGAEIQNIPDEECNKNEVTNMNGYKIWCCNEHAKQNCELNGNSNT